MLSYIRKFMVNIYKVLKYKKYQCGSGYDNYAWSCTYSQQNVDRQRNKNKVPLINGKTQNTPLPKTSWSNSSEEDESEEQTTLIKNKNETSPVAAIPDSHEK